MARITIFNFNNGGRSAELPTNKFYQGDPVVVSAGLDSYCVNLHPLFCGVYYVLPTAKSELYVSFLMKHTDHMTGRPIISFYNNTTLLGQVCRGSGHYGKKLALWRGSFSTILAESTMAINEDSYLLEVRYKPHDTAGVFQAKINGILVCDYSGDTTQGTTTITKLLFGDTSGISYACYWLDNIVIDDANWPGDTVQTFLAPTGAGAYSQWDVVSGSNYEAVDAVPVDDKVGVYTNTNGELDSYAVQDLPAGAVAVKCVKSEVRGFRNGATAVTKLAAGVRVGGSDYTGTGNTIPAITTGNTAGYAASVEEINPNTSAAWTPTQVNGAEVIIKAET